MGGLVNGFKSDYGKPPEMPCSECSQTYPVWRPKIGKTRLSPVRKMGSREPWQRMAAAIKTRKTNIFHNLKTLIVNIL